jgi:hypothetical protein
VEGALYGVPSLFGAQMPATEATSRAKAVIDEGIKGQLATVKY